MGNESENQQQTIEKLLKELDEARLAFTKLEAAFKAEKLSYSRSLAEVIKNENYYRKVYQDAPVNYQSLDEKACFLDVNPAWLQKLGYTREEVIGHHFTEFMTAESAALVEKRFPYFKETGRINGFEFELVCKDGSVVFVTFDGIVEHHENGDFKQTHCIWSDISQRKKAEEAILVKHLAIESSINAIAITDLKGIITYVNPSFYKLWDIAYPGDVLGKFIHTFWKPETENHDLIPKLKMHTNWVGEMTAVNSQGKSFEVEVRANLVSDMTGKPVDAIFSFNDISVGKLASRALLENENSYRELFNNVTDAIYIQNREGIFLDVNEGAVKMYGYPREVLIGKSPLFVSAPGKNDLDAVASMIARVFEGEQQQFEFWGQRSNGEIFPKEVRAVQGTYFGEKVCIVMAHDITERKQAEKELRESETKFKSLVESTSDMIWETNLQGKYTYVSPQFTNLLGYPPEEVIGKSPFEFIYHENIAEIISNSEDIVKQSKPFNSLVNKYRHRDGHFLYFETSGVPVHSDLGELTGYRGVSRDITRRRLSDKELHKLSSVVQQNPNTIVITNLDGIMEYVNPAGCETSGYAIKELVGKSPSVFASGNTPRETYRSLWATIKSGQKWEGIFHNRKKTGELFWESALIVPIRDAEGLVSHYLCVKEDVTKRIKFEDALKESEERYRQLFEASPDAIILADIETGMLIDANPVACSMLGYSINKIRTLHQTQLHPARHKEFATESFEKHVGIAIRKEDQLPIESVVLRSDGTEIPVEVLSNNITLNGRNILQGVFRDITERLQVRNALMKAMEKAEASDKLKSAFLRNISHELRTPLNGIIGFSEMITQLDSSDEDRIEFSRMIKKSSTRLINTINGYMDISMIVSGLTEINKRSFLLSKFINKIRKHVVASCESRNLRLDIVFNFPERNIEIMTDEDLLSKIFYHLTDNAVKFTKKGSITVGYELKPGFHTFSVSDTGSGISEELLTVIFDVFRQADLSISRGYEGSGLGLSIARGFVKLLGGDLWVKSEINQGSTFWFTIPAEAIKPDLVEIPAKGNGELPLVVVAEDDDSNYKYLEIVLKKASFKVLRARNGFETVELCREHPNISLLITDMKMPGMDGLESTRKVREQLPVLPVIALSGLISSNDEQAALDAGCNEYMVKPVSKAKLLEAISKLMHSSH